MLVVVIFGSRIITCLFLVIVCVLYIEHKITIIIKNKLFFKKERDKYDCQCKLILNCVVQKLRNKET